MKPATLKPSALIKLDLLAAAKEANLLEALARHNKTLQHYESQRDILTNYQDRLTASWRNGRPIPAGDAIRAAKFAAQAEAARQHLAHNIKTEQDKQLECTTALAALRIRRKTLQERLQAAQKKETAQAFERAERNIPALRGLTASGNMVS